MRMKTATVLMLFVLGFMYTGQAGERTWVCPIFQVEPTFAEENGDKPDIKWFKDELGISPKYAEKDSGILGISWPHFLIMVFLSFFFVAGLAAVILRRKRTKALLMQLLKEESQDQSRKAS
jgi:hypothetical protein